MAKNSTTKVKNKKVKNAHANINLSRTPFQDETSKVLKCFLIIVGIIVIMYCVTVLILNHSTEDYTLEDKETSIQYDEILAGTAFQKDDKEYLVLFYYADDDTTYADMISNYQAKESHLPIYYVNLNNQMNKSVISNESNKDAMSAKELRIKNATLIRFVDHEIREYIDSEDEISEYLS